MTALCGGGTSSSRADFARFTYIAPSVVGAALNNVETKLAMAIAGVVGSGTYDLQSFCSTDPPADPGITSDDVFALFNPVQIFQWMTARQKFEDLIRRYLWPQLCKCDAGAQPSVPSAPSALVNFQYNPPALAPYPGGQPCGTFQYDHTIHPGDADFFTDLTPLPPGTTYASIDSAFTEISAGPNPDKYVVTIWWMTANGTFVNTGPFIGAPNATTFTHHAEGAISAGAPTHFKIAYQQFQDTATVDLPVTVRFYCGTLPTGGGGSPTPCPPDPLVQQLLAQLLGLVTLIQRQDVPFAYVQGALHSGLSGSGEITVQGLIGCLVTVTAHGSFTGTESADPDVLFEAGWFNWGNADGFSTRTFINCSPQISLPEAAGQYTRIGYTLPVGVTISIRELVREP